MSSNRSKVAWLKSALVCLLATCSLLDGTPASAFIFVRFDTVFGVFDVLLFDQITPSTVNNFLNYVDDGDYVHSIIHRSRPNFLIQGGGVRSVTTSGAVDLEFIPTDPPVMNEPFIANTRGTIAMAKRGPPPGQPPTPQTINSATSQWYINLEDNPDLDDSSNNGGFTPFGLVLGAGMDVVDAIAALPTIDGDTFASTLDDLPVRNYGGGNVQVENLVIVNSITRINLFGDANNDGLVTGADLISVQRNFASTGPADGLLLGDANDDGLVTGVDLLRVQQNFGATIRAPTASPIPEPGSVGLLVVGLFVVRMLGD